MDSPTPQHISADATEDVWHLALAQVLGTWASDPEAAKAAAWQLVSNAPPALSVALAHRLQVLSALLAFELEGRYDTAQAAAFEATMASLADAGPSGDTALLLLTPFMLARCRWEPNAPGIDDDMLEGMAALARDRSRFQLAQDAWWPTQILASLLTLSNSFEAALHAGFHALALAKESAVAAYQQQSRTTLTFALLSMNDVEGALGVIEEGGILFYGKGVLGYAALNNHLLALLLAGRLQDAQALVARHPQLEDKQVIAGRPGLCASKALLHLGLGEQEKALQVFSLSGGVWSQQAKAMMANRCWIRARILIALGRHAEAATECERGFVEQQARGFAVSPMNAAQIHKAASDALAQLGDHRGAALAAERASASYLDWLKSATRARLVTLGWSLDRAPQVLAPKMASVALLEQLTQQFPVAQEGEANLRMVAHVSHEMRNPIAGLLGMTSLLMDTQLDETQRRYIELARSSAEMLMSLCNDLLDMAQLDNGRFALRPAVCDLGQASQQACQTFMSHAALKTLDMNVDIQFATLADWVCDEMRFKQILMNLISNAVKFTPRNGRIDVRVRMLAGPDQRVRVEVQDTGRGISAQEQARLFQDFSQLPHQSEHTHANMNTSGVGLGLALSRRLARQMNGDMGVTSALGKGSTFWFEIPVATAVPALEATASSQSKVQRGDPQA